ncbi:HAD family hydrolase, partial [Streptomyces sp. NPDC058398]
MKIHAEALLFDNDGTLVSSLESVNRCWTLWAEEYGITAEDFAAIGLHGRPAVEIAADLLPAARVPEALARIEQLEVDDVPGGVAALPGTLALHARLPAPRGAVVPSATPPRPAAPRDPGGSRPKTLVCAHDGPR